MAGMKRWRRAILALAAGWAIAGPTRAATPPRPKLIVVIAVDQFSAELFDRYRASFTGGLKRLSRGVRFTGYQSHAATETCPGHSTILTGRHPAATGIVANEWFDRDTHASTYCVAVPGYPDAHARGPQNLRVGTFGDWLKASDRQARVVSVSGKDRAAIMLGGHDADAVYWWTDGEGFVTSSLATHAPPTAAVAVAAFNAELSARWRAAPPALWPVSPTPACARLESPHRFGQLALSGRVPPDLVRDLDTTPGFADRPAFQLQLRSSPLFDAVTLELAGRLLATYRLGRDAGTDLLAVSLSATDYVGHRFGNGGAEMCQQVRALDQALGLFLTKLDAIGTPYMVVLTADHGGTDAVERAREHGVTAPRIDAKAIVATINAELQERFALARPPIAATEANELTIDIADPALAARIRDAAVRALRQRPEIARVLTAEEVAAAVPPPGTPPERLSVAERFHESHDPRRGGDIQLAFVPRASIGIPVTFGDAVAGHGSPWDYDRRVPILFWWPGVRQDHARPGIETVDIAPTLAAVAHVPAPQVDGRCLDRVAGPCPGSSGR